METCRKTGRRAAFAEDVINDELVHDYEAGGERHARNDVRNKLKWVRQHLNRDINLPLSAWYLLDELISLSHDVDWTGGPITVWPSNELMLTWLDVSERQLQILLTKLRKASFICFIDSPTQQRWGRRDSTTGRIVEAYGIDLRPLAQRVPALIALAERAQAERYATIQRRRTAKALVARISEYIRTARRDMDEVPGAANDNWDEYAAELARAAKLIEPKRVPLAVLDAVVELLRPLEHAVKKAIAKLFRPRRPLDGQSSRQAQQKTSSTDESRFTHKTTTKPPSSTEELVELSKTRVGGSVGGLAAPSAPAHFSEKRRTKADNARWTMAHLAEYRVSASTVLKACPSIVELGDQALPVENWDWVTISEAALAGLSIMGVGAHAWKALRYAFGDIGAVVAAAIISEKFTQGARGQAPIVASPGGYAYWLARSADELNHIDLGPKIHGLLKPSGRSAA